MESVVTRGMLAGDEHDDADAGDHGLPTHRPHVAEFFFEPIKTDVTDAKL